MTVPAKVPWPVYQVRLLRCLRRGFRRSLVEEVTRAKALRGDFVWVRLLGPMGFHLVSDPVAIHHLMVKNAANYIRGEPAWTHLRRGIGNGLILSDGERHRLSRKQVGRAFTGTCLRDYFPIVQHCLDEKLDAWAAPSSKVVDLHKEMIELTVPIIGRILFNVDLRRQTSAIAKAVMDVNAAATHIDASLLGRLSFVPTKANRRLRRAARLLDDMVYPLILAELGKEMHDSGVLGHLAQDAVASDCPFHAFIGRPRAAREQPVLRQIRDELITLFSAGHETLAGMLTWTFHLLAQHPDVEQRLHAELESVLGDRSPVYEDLARLTYTECVIRESMRLFPPVWINGRQSVNADQLGPYTVRPGTMLWTLSYLVHRDARWFPDPERFDPDRFAAGALDRPKFSYFPFGGGQRQCIGQGLAEMEGKLLLAGLARRFLFRPIDAITPDLDPMITLQPRGGLPMHRVQRPAATVISRENF